MTLFAIFVRLGNGQDKFAHAIAGPAGQALVSLWRWKRQLPSDATGSPALLLNASGPRTMVVGAGNQVFALATDGSLV